MSSLYVNEALTKALATLSKDERGGDLKTIAGVNVISSKWASRTRQIERLRSDWRARMDANAALTPEQQDLVQPLTEMGEEEVVFLVDQNVVKQLDLRPLMTAWDEEGAYLRFDLL